MQFNSSRVRALCAALFLHCIAASPLPASPPPPLGHDVNGVIVASEGNVPLPGAQVRLVELDREVFSGADGSFVFARVPAGVFTLAVELHGFSSYHARVDVPSAEMLTVVIAPAQLSDEITVTASPFAVNRLEVAQQVDVVPGEVAKREGTASLGQALASTPGVANIPTGEALGTPVIRGLSENRIRVLNDGVPLNHQQFSWRHSPAVETSLAQTIEVVRGPESVLYGPDAMGGVINVIHSPLLSAYGSDSIMNGEIAAGWGTNAGEATGRAEAEGATGAFGWNVGLVRRDSGDIETPDGTLENTDFEQTNGNAAVGLTGAWGTARVRWNHWELATGFYRPVGFRLDLEDDLVAADLFVPTAIGALELKAGHQSNVREAYPQGINAPRTTDLEQVTTSVRAGLLHRAVGPLRGRIALESVGVDSSTALATDLVPDYESRGNAAMLFEEARFFPAKDGLFDRLIVSFGARWDDSDLTVEPDTVRHLPDGFSEEYQALTGSLGAVWRATGFVSVAANVGRGWRPPGVFELFANGLHGGVSAIQKGNPELDEETNLNREVSLRVGSRRVNGYVTGYRTDFDDFIDLADSGSTVGNLPVFVYRQSDATIEGVEASLEIAPTDTLRLGAAYTWIETENGATGNALPQEPADRWLLRGELEGEALGPLRSPFVGLDVHLVASQEISGPDEPFGTATDGYTLVDLRSGFDIPAGGLTWGLDLTVRNLFDEAYTDFLYSYKAVAQNPGRDIRLVGRIEF